MSLSRISLDRLTDKLCNSCGLEIEGMVAVRHVCTKIFHEKCLPFFEKICPSCDDRVIHADFLDRAVNIGTLSGWLDILSVHRLNISLTDELKRSLIQSVERIRSHRFHIGLLLTQVVDELAHHESVIEVAKRHAAFADLLLLEGIQEQIDGENFYYIPNEIEIREATRGFFGRYHGVFKWISKNGDLRMRQYIKIFKDSLMHSPNAIRGIATFRETFVEDVRRFYYNSASNCRGKFLQSLSQRHLEILLQDPLMHAPANHAIRCKKMQLHRTVLQVILLVSFVFALGSILAYSRVKR